MNAMIPSSITQYYHTEPKVFDRFVNTMIAETEDTYEPLPINYDMYVDPIISGDASQIISKAVATTPATADAEPSVVTSNEATVGQQQQRSSSMTTSCKRKRDSVCPSVFMEALARDSLLARGARASFLGRESFLFRGSLSLPKDVNCSRDSFLQRIDDAMFNGARNAPSPERQPQPQPPAAPPAKKQRKETSTSAPKQKEAKWLAMLEALKSYKAEHGDCIVPRGWSTNPKLASWVAEQRKQYKLMVDGKTTNITPERVAFLEEVGFAWNAQEAAWARHFADLEKYKEEFGDCLVALSYDASPQLGLWVKEQRRHYALLIRGRKSHITDERVKKLESIGFCWDSHTATWWERYRELECYQAQFGDCLVPTTYEPNKRLGTWVHHQRRQYRKLTRGQPSHMTEERAEALNKIGFCWFPREDVAAKNRQSDHESSMRTPIILSRRTLSSISKQVQFELELS